MIPLISVVAPGPTATVPEKAPAPLPPKITKLCVPIWSRGPVYPGGFRASRPFRAALLMSSVPVSEESRAVAGAPVRADVPDDVGVGLVVVARVRVVGLVSLLKPAVL